MTLTTRIPAKALRFFNRSNSVLATKAMSWTTKLNIRKVKTQKCLCDEPAMSANKETNQHWNIYRTQQYILLDIVLSFPLLSFFKIQSYLVNPLNTLTRVSLPIYRQVYQIYERNRFLCQTSSTGFICKKLQ